MPVNFSFRTTKTPAKSEETPPSHTGVPKSNTKVPTSYQTHRSYRAKSSPARSEGTPPSHTAVPTNYPTIPTASPEAPVRPTIGTTSRQKTISPISRGSGPTSTRSPQSSPPPATAANSTTTHTSTGTSPGFGLTSASKTVTVSGGHTASAQVGWIIVGVGIGGSVSVGGNILPVAGGTVKIIEENSSGQDELSTIESDISTSRSTSRSSSSSSSSSKASPTPYNIYPKLDSTPPQQSTFAQHLGQIARPGSVRSITGGRGQLLLWVASLIPAQASELSRNPVVSSVTNFSGCRDLNVLIRSVVLTWIRQYGLIWKG